MADMHPTIICFDDCGDFFAFWRRLDNSCAVKGLASQYLLRVKPFSEVLDNHCIFRAEILQKPCSRGIFCCFLENHRTIKA